MGKLPRLIEYGSLLGDLQTQTDWTDGADSIGEMAKSAKARGLEYIAITDHTRDLAMTRGADEAKLARQGKEIDSLNAKLRGFRVLRGAEVNIRRDGTLDIEDSALAALDVVGVAVHSHFDLPRAEMTERVCRAMRNPHADILFHPTGRMLGKREPLRDRSRRSHPRRSRDRHGAGDRRVSRSSRSFRRSRAARGRGRVKLTIDSDAHASAHFAALDYGVAVARRGWVEARQVLNTLPVDELLAALKDHAGRKPRRRR